MTGLGPRLVNPDSRFGIQHGEKLRAVADLQRSRTPVNLPTSDYEPMLGDYSDLKDYLPVIAIIARRLSAEYARRL